MASHIFLEKQENNVISVVTAIYRLTLVMLNKLRCHTHFLCTANQITWSRLLILVHILNDKQCRSRSVGFFRSQLIWIYTVCEGMAYLGSAKLGLMLNILSQRNLFCTVRLGYEYFTCHIYPNFLNSQA